MCYKMLKTNIEQSLDNPVLTPATAMLAELVRRYWILGMECSLLEIHKLAWFLERAIEQFSADKNPLKLQFVPHKYGPYANRLDHLLNSLDGSYLHCDKRISDADPLDVIWFDEKSKDFLHAYLKSEAKPYAEALERTAELIDGFESPFGMELLATVDWLITRENVKPTVAEIREGLKRWPADSGAAERKLRLFDERAIGIALDRLNESPVTATA
ncbi:MAG: hypothetical protein Kow0065_03690 [Methylomicrobium sp.]